MSLNINDIQMHKWYDHEPFAFYHGLDLTTGRKYWIKMLKTEYPSQQDVQWLINEYENGQTIQLDELIRPLRLESYNNSTILLLEHSEGHPLSQLAASGPLEMKLFLRLSIAMTEMIRKLHQLKYIHLNLSPHAFVLESGSMSMQLTNIHNASHLSSNDGIPAQPAELMFSGLPYMAPEQFGRMERSIDYRTDIYSLGIVFYELLTGTLPFDGADATEWIHQHMTKQPITPFEACADVPKPVSDIVMKCLAKHPEHRYQSAFALKCDLEACLAVWLKEGFVDNVSLGANAATDIFHISDSLYGRDQELADIQNAYHRMLLGSREMVFVSGLSGVGKSFLIHEFRKSVQTGDGLFISGKFEQFKRDMPFQAIQQAGQQIVHYLLTLGEASLLMWKKKIADAVGPNGQVLIDMIPDMEKIIGSQPPLSKLPPAEMHNRFLITVQQFLGVFATREHPLTVFIDDLQWADPASLQLIQDLASQNSFTYSLFIGTYRSNEVTDTHPLSWMMDKLRRLTHINLVAIELEALGETDVKHLLKDTLGPAHPSELGELTSMLIEKTKGNPFFTKQFLRSLYDYQLLAFNYDAGSWDWDIAKIKELHITDNVVDFMINKIRRQPESVQQLLMKASCIGHVFPMQLLALAASQDSQKIERELRSAVDEGLIVAVSEASDDQPSGKYAFLHDRVHQAVYSLVPKHQKKELHHLIGKLMLDTFSEEALEEYIFEIANQLNLGKELLVARQEKERLAGYNMRASRKAKANTAYETALKYVTHCVRLLDEDSWNGQYELAFSVYLELAELEYLCGHFEEAKRSFELILRRARTKMAKADAYNLMMVLYTNLGLHEQAMEMGLEGLRLFGIPLQPAVKRSSILLELAKTKWHMLAKQPEDLFDLPQMVDPDHRAVMRLMVNLIAPTYYLNSDLYIYLMLKMFNYSLRYGNSEGSALAYSTYGVIISSIFGDIRSGAKYGKVGLMLCDAFDHLPIKCKVYFGFGAFTNNVTQHIETNLLYLKKAYQFGVESGDFVYGGYSIAFSFFLRLYKGDPLGDVYNETELYHPFVLRAQDKDTIYIMMVLQRFMLFNKEEPVPQANAKPGDPLKPFMSKEELEQLQSFSNKATIHTYYALQLLTYYMLGRQTEAKQLMDTAEQSLQFVFGLIHVQLFYFISSLVMTAIYEEAEPAEKKMYWRKLQKHLKIIKKWSVHSPDTFLHQKLLIEAEMNRISGSHSLAAVLYEQAIFHAGKQRFVHIEAIANECAAKFYMHTGKLKIARSYWIEAKMLYSKWGAARKVAELEDKHPYLINRAPSAHSAIDVTTVAKASQALSSEAVFHKLLESFMHIVMENAGAEKGLLLLIRDHRLYVEVEKRPDKPFAALHSIPLEEYEHAALSAVQYAMRKEEPLLLHDAAGSQMFPKDVYIQTHLPKSMLILPIMKLGKMIGVLYLENNLATHVFQEQRLDTLKLLTSEIAVTIENSTLYANLEHKNYALRLLEEQEKNVRLQLDEKERWVQSSEATMLNIRKAQHELINNVQTVHALLMMNKYDMAKDYISVWCKEIVQQSVVNSVKFPVLGVVLNNISLPCISGKIELQVTGDLDCTFDGLTLPISYFSSIVHNLLKNAIEAIPDDDPLRTLRLTIEELEDSYRLSIFNTGSYVEEAYRKKIFDKGFSTKSESTNSGLGLHIVQNYIHHYDGTIECHSEKGVGTTFTVCLKKKNAAPSLTLAEAKNP
ncbi:Serine/threonine-protein kinase PrkC [Paenibacillus konkukensis]|uniref:histidine kinase n=1 Tax=Paenibacillus konkukensis TaxID=2020716 RepID=A0ABY4RGW1_9BACL|nr:AAA family ATPase [Paenibacillus konkukensis]UQZ81582.1 Serine/threonine-protein kinase PrkC [Paenibacillus konkukensis]